MANAALDVLGEFLIANVRDKAISDWNMILDGKMKGQRAVDVRRLLATFSDAQTGVLRSLIPQIVDSTLHHLLWSLEQTDSVRVRVSSEGVDIPDIKVVSDGLAGELPSNQGWIARFSKRA